MNIYKFQDEVDKKFCFIIAKQESDATIKMKELTSIPFKIVEVKLLERLDMVFVVHNEILPF